VEENGTKCCLKFSRNKNVSGINGACLKALAMQTELSFQLYYMKLLPVYESIDLFGFKGLVVLCIS